MKVALAMHDERMPRTLFHQRFIEALQRNRRFISDPEAADILFPAEDVSLEQHWPRYGDQESAYIRGKFDGHLYEDYLHAIRADDRSFCIVNLHPVFRVPQWFADRSNVIVADANLHMWERALNPRTIAMPVLGVTCGRAANLPRTILASFRGEMSHVVRQGLAKLHDGVQILCEMVDRSGYVKRIDVLAGKFDQRYTELLQRSIFAFVPRGDALYSYRLTEVISFGCIPVVLSDGWVLPFDRTIDWSRTALVMPESTVADLPRVLKAFPPLRIQQMQVAVARIRENHFADLDVMVESLLCELEILLGINEPTSAARTTASTSADTQIPDFA